MVVLVQNSKGGGLASNFTSAGQSMGVRKTADFLEKSTWTLGAAILVLCLAATASIPRGQGAKESVIKSSIERAQDPNAFRLLLYRCLCRKHRYGVGILCSFYG